MLGIGRTTNTLKRMLIAVLLLLCFYSSSARSYRINYLSVYNQALDSIASLAWANQPKTFKDAVLIVENTYYSDSLDVEAINDAFSILASFARGWASANHIVDYSTEDSGYSGDTDPPFRDTDPPIQFGFFKELNY